MTGYHPPKCHKVKSFLIFPELKLWLRDLFNIWLVLVCLTELSPEPD
jgi:hypothetical protein